MTDRGDARTTHALVEPLLGPAALGVLDAQEQGLVDAHVATCDGCAAELRALTAVADRLGTLAPEQARLAVEPLAPLGDRLVAAAARDARRTRRRTAALASAAAAVVLAAGVTTAVVLDDDDDAAPAVAGPVVREVPVRAAGGLVASAGVVDHTWGVEIKLRATGLAAGGAYDVEVVDDAGRASSAGRFLGTGERTLTCNLNSAVLLADAASFVVRDPAGAEVVRGEL